MIIAGEISIDNIQSIEENKEYFVEHWYESMQRLIERNKGGEVEWGEPKGIVKGILEDSEEIQAIINRDWEKLEAIQKSNGDK